MTHAGAKGNTEAQMAKVMHFEVGQGALHPAFAALIKDLNGRDKKSYALSVANALWAQKDYTFRKEYLAVVRDQYQAGIENLDFVGATEEARKTINAWVEKQTNDKIKELFKPGVLDDLTRLVLTNAIYFKGNWATQFDKKLTKDAPFTLADGKKVDVPMMYRNGNFNYAQVEGFQMLELPYRGNELSMLVLLPEKADGIADLESKLTAVNLSKWLPLMHERKLPVYIPKFKMTSEFSLKQTLSSMGMPDAFNMAKADFSGMTGKKDLYIGAVVHKAFVDVNEEGTEAAAATGVVMETQAFDPTVFRADHPFLFLIRDTKTGSILFMGRLSDPRS